MKKFILELSFVFMLALFLWGGIILLDKWKNNHDLNSQSSDNQTLDNQTLDNQTEDTCLTIHELKYADSPSDNPLKGFAGYQGTGEYSDFPVSIEYITIPVSSLVIGKGEYDWEVLDDALNSVSKRGRTSILAFYLDIPGDDMGDTAIPEYLLNNNLTIFEYSIGTSFEGEQTGYSPDYSNKELWNMIYDFVEKLGTRYDGDARICEIEASIAGIWGEWHTGGYDFGLSDDNLLKLAQTYDDSFNSTQISCRYPKSGTEELNVGYSDYSFCYETIVDAWSQLNQLEEYGVTDYWKSSMGGGELYPQYVAEIFDTDNWELKNGESFFECLEALHSSWLLVGNVNDFSSDERLNAVAASKMLGYDFSILNVSYADIVNEGTVESLVEVSIANKGSAPFYYNWSSEIYIYNNNELVLTKQVDWDLTTIQPDDEPKKFSTILNLNDLPEGNYQIYYKVINPLENGYPLLFANETQKKDGELLLGSFQITNTQDYYDEEEIEIVGATLGQENADEIGLEVSSKYFANEIGLEDDFSLGIRIRNYGSENVNETFPKICIYSGDELISEVETDWDLSLIDPETSNYYSWMLAFDEKGKYQIKISFTNEDYEVEVGEIKVM